MTDNLSIRAEVMDKIRAYVEQKAKQLAPTHIAPWIRSETPELTKSGTWGFPIRVDMERMPEGSSGKSARAYEYGSGIHAQRGRVGKYKIEPKTPGGMLVFPWDKLKQTPKQAARNPNKIAKFRSVVHPGVKASNAGKGYIREAMVQSKPYITETIKEAGADFIKTKVRAIFSRPGGRNK